MIIREDLDTKLRKALAIHYGLDKVYVQKINPTGFDVYRIKIKINDKFRRFSKKILSINLKKIKRGVINVNRRLAPCSIL